MAYDSTSNVLSAISGENLKQQRRLSKDSRGLGSVQKGIAFDVENIEEVLDKGRKRFGMRGKGRRG
jgi:hypothetical protein